MKKNISILVLVIISVMAVNSLNAQGQRKQGPPPIPDSQQIEKMVNDLTKELSLSSTQHDQVLEIYNDHFDKVKLIDDSGLDRENKQKEMEKEKDLFQSKVNSVLNEEQQKEYKEYVKKNKQKRGGPPPRR